MKKFLLFAFLTLAFLSCEPEEFADVEEITSKQQPLLSQNGTGGGNSDILGKVTVGYQGWFTANGDGSGFGLNWFHWSGGNAKPNIQNVNIDLWPDVSEYTETYNAGFSNLHSGRKDDFFSSTNQTTVDIHFKWMKQYGIHTVALQRFLTDIYKPLGGDDKVWRNIISNKVRNAANDYDLKFYTMYDLNNSYQRLQMRYKNGTGSFNATQFANDLFNDWGYTHSGHGKYAKQNGRRVVSFFNVGAASFYDNTLTTTTDSQFNEIVDIWVKLINRFKRGDDNILGTNDDVYIIISPPRQWPLNGFGISSTPNGQSATYRRDEVRTKVYQLADAIMPWRPDAKAIEDSASIYGELRNSLIAGQTEINDNSKYPIGKKPVLIPIAYPGFSDHNVKENKNLTGGEYNVVPRDKGQFFWDQIRAIKNSTLSNKETVYVAMFDEYDEGTAIMKAAETEADKPTNTSISEMITLDRDGVFLSNDFYLRLTGNAGRFLRNDHFIIFDNLPKSNYFSECESLNNDFGQSWSNEQGNNMVIKTNDEKQRYGAIELQANNGNFVSLKKIRANGQELNPRIYPNSNTAVLTFWLKVVNVGNLNSNVIVEIGSTNSNDQNEIQWSIPQSFFNGKNNQWVKINLPINSNVVNPDNYLTTTNRSTTGSINLNKIKRFRIHTTKKNNTNIILRLDAIQVIP